MSDFQKWIRDSLERWKAMTPEQRAPVASVSHRYRKKPVVIEARQWTGANAVDLLAWTADPNNYQRGQSLFIWTLEGWHEASLNDWIIKGVKGEFYPCKPDIFAATYELLAALRTDP